MISLQKAPTTSASISSSLYSFKARQSEDIKWGILPVIPLCETVTKSPVNFRIKDKLLDNFCKVLFDLAFKFLPPCYHLFLLYQPNNKS